MTRTRRSISISLLLTLALPLTGLGQTTPYETDWYRPDRPYLKLRVFEDGIYRVNMNELAAFIPAGSADAASLRLFENGREIPIDYHGEGGPIGQTDYFLFAGRRNTAEDELWAYNYDPTIPIDNYQSLYSDTTFYFLTWGHEPGLRYADSADEVTDADTLSSFPARARFQTTNNYSFGISEEQGRPFYTRGEGWMTRQIGNRGSDRELATQNLDVRDMPGTSADSLRVEAVILGASGNARRVILSVRLLLDGQHVLVDLDSLEVDGYRVAKLTATVPQDQLRPGGNDRIRIGIINHNAFAAEANRIFLHHIAGTFEATLSVDDGQFNFIADRSGPTVYQFSSSDPGEVVVLKPDERIRFALPADGTFGDVTSQGEEFFVSSTEDFKRPIAEPDASSNLADPNQAHDFVIISAPGLKESAEALKAYRESAEGGGYRVLLVDVQDVFDQFDYARPTPIAIRRFIDHSRSWRAAPEFFVLWGDALYADPKKRTFSWEVPSFGHASGDGWFAMFAGDDPQDFNESVSLGRLPMRTNQLGEIFVEKLRSYESQSLAEWHKQVTLMAGGVSVLEQSLLHSATRSWGEQIGSAPFGADVTYFLKSEATALDPTFLDSVDAAIARGTSWLAFFGHSAADQWEIVTTPPPSFNNADNLPIAISLGCFTGAFARGTGSVTDSPVYAELLVTESENGAIAHFGGSTSSLISTARNLAQALYDVVFETDIRTLGPAVREAKRTYMERFGINPVTIETNMQYNLIGDPATRLRLPTKPDFHVEGRSLLVEPAVPVAGLDTVMTVGVEVRNRGTVPSDSILVALSHISPANVRTEYVKRVPPFPLTFETVFQIPFLESDLGDHRFELAVDPGFEHEEEIETNNQTEKTHTVFASGVIQLFPRDFGLVTSRQPVLQLGAASTSGEELPVFVELDSVVTFDSPLLMRDEIQLSSVTQWRPPSPLSNGRSYFWRARVDDPSLETRWATSSFTVREDLPTAGWLQQGRQFAENTHGRFLEYTNGRWRFKQFNVDVLLRSAVHLGEPLANSISVAGVNYLRGAQGFGVVVLDSRGNVKEGGVGSFILYKHRDDVVPEEELLRLDSLLSIVEEGDYVLVNTFLRRVADDAEGILEGGKKLFRDLGSTMIDSVGFLDMWNFATRVGAAKPILDIWIDHIPGVTDINHTDVFTIPVNFGASETVSPAVGPATSWGRLQWTSDISVRQATIDVSVLSMNGDTLARSSLARPGGTAMIDLSSGPDAISADEHPFIKLVGQFSDPSLTATPQLLNWYLAFESVAELTILGSGLDVEPDTLAEGDTYNPSVTVINAAGARVDSVFVTYDVTDAENVTTRAFVDTLLDVPPNTSLESTAVIETFGRVGRNQVTATVRQPDPREPIPYNNTAIGYFFVAGDTEPPLFNVTVDGVEYPSDPRVINSTDDPTLPFLSVRPTFEISVSDENQFQPLSDTTVITILLDDKRVSYARPEVVFEPGDSENNQARLSFMPDFAGQDTTHTIKIYAQDAAGNFNPSKDDPYTFSFRVQTEAEVESLYPYPNPMNNFTSFMFRLRGADPSLVEDLRIRVYTISGRIVREFDLVQEPSLLAAGGLQIGWNRVPWDGRDADGDLLGNGVYLYKVFLRAEGEEMTVNNETGIEKIAIVR